MSTFKSKLFGVLSAAWSIFIFSNSFKSGVESSQASDSIVNTIIKKLGLTIDVDLLTLLIRKAAHLTEFFILGILVALCFYYLNSKFKYYTVKILFIGMSAGLTDEFIQSFINGRSSEVRDVVIDFCGVLIGYIVIYFVDKSKRKHKYKYSYR